MHESCSRDLTGNKRSVSRAINSEEEEVKKEFKVP
jgi:hypothetical protein